MKAVLDQEYVLAFGANLRKVRKAKNMSMEKLAEEAGLEYSQISRIELGQINTKITTVRAIANGLKIPEMDLFDFKIS